MENTNENYNLNPQEYFDKVKEKKHKITDEELNRYYDTCLQLIDKYRVTGQTKGLRKLIFHIETIEKEREILQLGVDTFVYRDDIEEYIDKVEKKTVKIIELSRYEREIPDEIVEVIRKVKDKFDRMYVVFTDYTGKVEKQVTEERRKKDPILFGTFQDLNNTDTVVDRFYFLGDWVDEYCDLTLDKMVAQVKKEQNKDILHKMTTPTDIKQLKEELEQLEPTSNGLFRMSNTEKKPNLFSRVRTAIVGDKKNG